MKKYLPILYIISSLFIFCVLFGLYFNGNFDKNFELPENPKKIIIEVGNKKEQYVINLNDLVKESSYTYNVRAKTYNDKSGKVAQTGSVNGNFSIINSEVFNGTEKTYTFLKWFRDYPFYWYMNTYIIKLGFKHEDKIPFPNLSLINAKDGSMIWIIPVGDDGKLLYVSRVIGYIE